MRTLAFLVLDLWCYARWLFLKLASGLLRVFSGRTEDAEQIIIRLGNRVFPPPWADNLFDSYETYDRFYPVNLKPYLALSPAEVWLTGKDILDLGAGLGGYSRALRVRGARHVVSLEYQLSKAHYAHRHRVAGVETLSASASALPFVAGSFDSVLSNTVFEHLPDVAAALREICRVLRPGGLALIGFNFFTHRGGHHLFPYISFPWPTWVVSEKSACRYWSQRLKQDQTAGRMRFYPQGSAVETLAQGNEISLNRMDFQTFERLVHETGLEIVRRTPSETIGRLFPRLVAALPIRDFLMGTVFYALRRPE